MGMIEKRVGKKGTSFRARIRVHGLPKQAHTFSKLVDAKKWIQQVESDMHRGLFQDVLKEGRSHTFNDLMERYRKEILPYKAKTTQYGEQGLMKYWTVQFGEYALAFISQQMIADKLYELQNGGNRRNLGPNGKPIDNGKLKAKSTLKHYRDYLEHYFNCAKQWGWIGTNPVASIRRYTKLNNARVRYLSDEERQALLEACAESKNHQLYTIVVFALSTGVRRGELMNLALKDLDFQRSQAILRATKNGDTRVVPIVGYLRQIMEEHVLKVNAHYTKLEESLGQPIKAQYLFPSQTGQVIDFSNAFDFARKRANLEDFRFHDLRHCTASYAK